MPVTMLTDEQIASLPDTARSVVDYRKSGLSLNHVQGCPLDCAYCIRHTYGVWDMRIPKALMSDAQAVEKLVTHHYFQPHVTPIQVFNRATDPFLPRVKDHLFAVLEDLDARGLTNHVLVITRWRVQSTDCARLNRLRNIKLTLLFTYSGIADQRIEPVRSDIAEMSLRRAFRLAESYTTVLYWRPLVPGLNDSPEYIAKAAELSRTAHATVFTGLFFKGEIEAYYRDNNLPLPYDDSARRKILPAELEQRVLDGWTKANGGPLFRKTSCGVVYTRGLPDYNGHYGIRELCDICPLGQLQLCADAHKVPTEAQVRATVARLSQAEQKAFTLHEITERAALVGGLDEQPRYYLQHSMGFQVHDARHPHRLHQHGRAPIGWDGKEATIHVQ